MTSGSKIRMEIRWVCTGCKVCTWSIAATTVSGKASFCNPTGTCSNLTIYVLSSMLDLEPFVVAQSTSVIRWGCHNFDLLRKLVLPDFPYSYSLVHPQMNPILLIMIRFSIFDSILPGWKKPRSSYNRNYRVLCLRNYIVCWDLGFGACGVHSSLFSLPNQWSNGAPLFGWKAPDWKILRQVSGLQINGWPIMSHG